MPVYSLPKYRRERQFASGVNWRRGSYRLWILASFAWILGWGVYLSIYAIQFGEGINQLRTLPVLLLAPPSAMLVFGWSCLWALRGFIPTKRGSLFYRRPSRPAP